MNGQAEMDTRGSEILLITSLNFLTTASECIGGRVALATFERRENTLGEWYLLALLLGGSHSPLSGSRQVAGL